jgi:methionyl-tRNA formyltransferase
VSGIVVFGYSDVGHACLKFLLDRQEPVVAVYTHADKPGEDIWFPSVRKLAEERGVPVVLEEDLSRPEESERLSRLAPDLILSFYYRNLIPAAVLSRARRGAFNMHGSLLPKYRGRAPVNWAVLHGEPHTGATLHEMVARADAGDIVDQEAVDIGPDDTAAEVQSRVTAAAVRVLERQIGALKSGTAPRRPQNDAEATTFGRRGPQDGEIQWTRPAREIHNLVRAVTHPYPGAFGSVRGAKTFIWKTRIPAQSRTKAGTPPGAVFVRSGRLCVACGDGNVIEVLSAQRPGGPELAGDEFARRHVMASTEEKS